MGIEEGKRMGGEEWGTKNGFMNIFVKLAARVLHRFALHLLL